jgi:uncharacterized membrane protein HdeD (DUF308 family)
MAVSEPAPGGRPSLGEAVGQAWVLFLGGFLALAGGVSLLLNPGADLRLIRWLVGLFVAGWGGCDWSTPPEPPAATAPG